MPKKSKILYLVTQAEWGGAQRYIFDLATNLSQESYDIAVAAGAAGSQDLFTKVDAKNIKSYRLKNLVREINPIKDIKAYFEIKKLLKDLKPDILHLNSSKAGVVGAIAGKNAGVKKIIYTVHGFVFNEPLPWWKKMFYLWAEKISARSKHKIICVSEFDKQVGLKNKIGAKKLITIHNGIKNLKFLDSLQARQELNLPENKKIIGTIANFYPTKGLTYLISAAKIVKQQFPGVIFAIIGDGQLRQALEAQIEQQELKNDFILLGRRENAYQYLSIFDIYVVSSVKEGLPYSVLEAMAAGLPTVTTKVGGIPEIIDNNKNGILIEPKNPQSLADAIIKLIENKNLASQLASQAKLNVAEKFSLEKMLTETTRVYQQ